MVVTFLEPGGDATFNVANRTSGGLWSVINGSPVIATDFVNGSHKKSIRTPSGVNELITPVGSIQQSGARGSFYVYFTNIVNTTLIFTLRYSDQVTDIIRCRMNASGNLFLTESGNGPLASISSTTFKTGVWYRISFSISIINNNAYSIKMYVNGVLDISATSGGTIPPPLTISSVAFGNVTFGTAADMRFSDFYVDNSSSSSDIASDVWVTAKRPNSNGTTNGFTTQIGAGGSGYGSGHSPQVNERALSTTNGWSMIGAGSAITEEYNIEGKSTGDIDISSATIVDWLGWAYMKSLVAETVQIVLGGVNNAQAITSTPTMYTQIKGSTIYPAGSGADIGVVTDTSLTTVSLYETGIIVAYTPKVYNSNFFQFF